MYGTTLVVCTVRDDYRHIGAFPGLTVQNVIGRRALDLFRSFFLFVPSMSWYGSKYREKKNPTLTLTLTLIPNPNPNPNPNLMFTFFFFFLLPSSILLLSSSSCSLLLFFYITCILFFYDNHHDDGRLLLFLLELLLYYCCRVIIFIYFIIVACVLCNTLIVVLAPRAPNPRTHRLIHNSHTFLIFDAMDGGQFEAVNLVTLWKEFYPDIPQLLDVLPSLWTSGEDKAILKEGLFKRSSAVSAAIKSNVLILE